MPPTRRDFPRFLNGLEGQFVFDALGLQMEIELVVARETLVVLEEMRQPQTAVQTMHLEPSLQGA
jgi:hypothetical protein